MRVHVVLVGRAPVQLSSHLVVVLCSYGPMWSLPYVVIARHSYGHLVIALGSYGTGMDVHHAGYRALGNIFDDRAKLKQRRHILLLPSKYNYS